MEKLPPMIDMRRDSGDEGQDGHYPYGLSISLENPELEKLGLDPAECEVGDLLHIHGLAKVTSVSKHDHGNGEDHRIELTITHIIDSPEDEDSENRKSEKEMKPRRTLYK